MMQGVRIALLSHAMVSGVFISFMTRDCMIAGYDIFRKIKKPTHAGLPLHQSMAAKGMPAMPM
jgi:hypothetical protein